jgi:hypothetical protein
MTVPGLMIAAPSSGAGKTTLTLGLLRALAQDGLAVQPFKNGPDYIDPAFHRAATGRASFNLDSWAMGAGWSTALRRRRRGRSGPGRSSMGLFDGVAGTGALGIGASADVARRLGWPVVLVLDASGQAQSAAATALGFARFDPQVRVAGVVFNKVASPRHERLLRDGMARVGLPVLGALPRRADLALPERHLGLVQALEHPDLAGALDRLADFVRGHVDLAALVALAAAEPQGTEAGAALSRCRRPGAAAGGGACGVLVPLSASVAGLAGGGRADPAVFAAGRRSPGRRGRHGLAAGRLSRTACRKARGGHALSGWPAPPCADPPGPRRMRRLHGIGAGAGGQGRRAPCHGRAARAGNQPCPAAAAPGLSRGAAAGAGGRAGGGHGAARARVPLLHDPGARRRAAGRGERCHGRGRGRDRIAARAGDRLVLPPDRRIGRRA